MPRLSRKRKLLDDLSFIGCQAMLASSSLKESDKIFSEVLDDVVTILAFRNSILRQPVHKSEEWFRNILPTYDDDRFKQFLRVSRTDFSRILSFIQDSGQFMGYRKQVPIDKQLAITLFKLGNDGSGSSNYQVAALFGVGDGGSVMKIVDRVIEALLELEDQWIQWPSLEERGKIVSFMENELPKCVGFIDGTEIKLDEAPASDPESYFSRKQQYSVKMQGICDIERRIRNIFVGFPGSVHDARIYTNSDFGKNPRTYLSGGQWIAGDSAYGVTEYLLTPFRSNSTFGSPKQRKQFNKYFASYRVKIECCFGIMKETFGSLKGLRIRINNKDGHKRACRWIISCCILYNMILESLEDFDISSLEIFQDEEQSEMEVHPNNSTGELKRQALCEYVSGQLGLM